MLSPIDDARYERQIQLPQVGETGQLRLKNARVLVIGAGGLAAGVLPILVGSGVGFIRLYDADVVDLSNLHRQTLYRMSDIGTFKVDAAAKHLQQLNPEVCIENHAEYVHSANLAIAMQNIDIVVDAADRFATTYLLSDYCFLHKLPLVSASVLAEQGYVGAFCGATAPSYAAIFPQLPQQAASCATAGVLPSSVAVLASMQAHMVINLILDLQPTALAQLIQINLSTWHIQAFSFQGAPEPEQPLLWLDEYAIQAHDRVLDFRAGHEIRHPFAAQVEYISFEQLASLEFDPLQRVICVCASGIRAAKAANVLRKNNLAVYIAAAL